MNDLKFLYKKMGYTFKDESLFSLAMMHPSFDKESKANNQRFEFLGDAILSYIISAALFERFPDVREGLLTRFRSLLVRKESLALMARSFNLEHYLLLGPGEKKQHPKGSDAILADALEALIAAIYLDGDSSTCEAVVKTWFHHQINTMPLKESHIKDPKSLLQEYLQKRKKPLPVYKVIFDKKASEDQKHIAVCQIQGAKSFKGQGPSRRQAEQAAAKAAFKHLNNQ